MRAAVDLLGVLTEVVMLYYLYENILTRKDKVRWQVYGVYVLVCVFFMLISTYVAQPRVRTLFYLIITLLPLAIYQSKWYIRTVASAIYMATQAVVEMTMKACLLSIYGNTGELPYELGVLLSKALAFFVIYLMVALFRVKAHTLSLSLFSALLVLPIATMIIIYQLIDISYLLNTRKAYLRLTVVSSLFISANIGLCYLFGRMAEMEEIRRRDELAQVQLELQQKQYAQLATHQQEIRHMYHDVKRYLQVIGEYLQVGQTAQAISYIQQQEVMISQQQLTITGYSLLDGVLAAKKEVAQRQGIQWQCEAHLSEGLTLPETDIAIILDNGLDNALEAVVQLHDQAKRWISIDIQQRQSFLHLTISNPTSESAPIKQGENLKTTKPDTANHGFGMANMRQLAQKHHGTMTYQCADDVFTVHVMVNIYNYEFCAAETALRPNT